MLQTMVIPSLKGRGWSDDGDYIVPVWFEGNQLPPTLTRSKKAAKRKNVDRKTKNCQKPSSSKEKTRYDQQTSYVNSSDTTLSSSSRSSSGWEIWEDEDFLSDASSNDPDW